MVNFKRTYARVCIYIYAPISSRLCAHNFALSNSLARQSLLNHLRAWRILFFLLFSFLNLEISPIEGKAGGLKGGLEVQSEKFGILRVLELKNSKNSVAKVYDSKGTTFYVRSLSESEAKKLKKVSLQLVKPSEEKDDIWLVGSAERILQSDGSVLDIFPDVTSFGYSFYPEFDLFLLSLNQKLPIDTLSGMPLGKIMYQLGHKQERLRQKSIQIEPKKAGFENEGFVHPDGYCRNMAFKVLAKKDLKIAYIDYELPGGTFNSPFAESLNKIKDYFNNQRSTLYLISMALLNEKNSNWRESLGEKGHDIGQLLRDLKKSNLNKFVQSKDIERFLTNREYQWKFESGDDLDDYNEHINEEIKKTNQFVSELNGKLEAIHERLVHFIAPYYLGQFEARAVENAHEAVKKHLRNQLFKDICENSFPLFFEGLAQKGTLSKNAEDSFSEENLKKKCKDFFEPILENIFDFEKENQLGKNRKTFKGRIQKWRLPSKILDYFKPRNKKKLNKEIKK